MAEKPKCQCPRCQKYPQGADVADKITRLLASEMQARPDGEAVLHCLDALARVVQGFMKVGRIEGPAMFDGMIFAPTGPLILRIMAQMQEAAAVDGMTKQ